MRLLDACTTSASRECDLQRRFAKKKRTASSWRKYDELTPRTIGTASGAVTCLEGEVGKMNCTSALDDSRNAGALSARAFAFAFAALLLLPRHSDVHDPIALCCASAVASSAARQKSKRFLSAPRGS